MTYNGLEEANLHMCKSRPHLCFFIRKLVHKAIVEDSIILVCTTSDLHLHIVKLLVHHS